jgi:type IV pilus assembly protein PilC
MKTFKYTARDLTGNKKEDIKEALSSNEVIAWLRDQRLTPVSVKEISVTSKKPKSAPRRRKKRIKSADLSALCWQLTTMVEGGIPVTTAIATIAEDIDNLQLQDILKQVVEKMEKGQPFSSSVSEFPQVFNQLFCAMIMAGETSGNLTEALRRLAEYFENRDKLIKKVKGAMAYPVFVLSFIIVIVIFIMTFIIPRFRVIFDQLGGQLPAFTQAFMSFYDMLRFNLIYIIGFVMLIIISSVMASKTKPGHRFFCKISLAIPLIGKVFKHAFYSTFCKTMSTLLGAGVSVLDVFDILATMTTNDIIKNNITKTKEHIVSGSSISNSMASTDFFPNLVIKMVQVGEQSGSLSTVLERTSVYYERKVDTTITTLMGLLEPIMIITVGAIVSVIVLALYLPIFSMSNVTQ